MAIVKVIEVIAESKIGWDEAAQSAIEEASKTIDNIQNIYIKDFKAAVENNKISKYRVIANISFIVKDL